MIVTFIGRKKNVHQYTSYNKLNGRKIHTVKCEENIDVMQKKKAISLNSLKRILKMS